MRNGTPGFIAARLTEAREARRITTMSGLARRLNVSPSTVSRWEDEDAAQAPDQDTLIQLASVLDVRPEFFLRPRFVSERSMFLRSLSSTLVRDLNFQRAQMRWLQEIGSVLQHYVDFPAVDIPDVLRGGSYLQLRDEDLEEIALELRGHWQLGEGPAGDIVTLMERVGIVVSSITMSTTKLDGLCNWSPLDDRPYVLLANDKMSFPRRQMDAAHELAHAILHRDVPEEEFDQNLKVIEKQAFRLGSALLMPSTTYPKEVRQPSLAMLATLKERWRVSIKAQIKRLSDLDIIQQDYATHLYKLYSAKGWSKGEPLDQHWPLREPRLLADSLRLIDEAGVLGKDDLLATEFTLSSGDIENLCNLPQGWFSRAPAEVVSLKFDPITSRPDGLAGMGTVVSFPQGGRFK